MANIKTPKMLVAHMGQLRAGTSSDQVSLFLGGLREPFNDSSYIAIRLGYHKQNAPRQLEPKNASRRAQDAKAIFRGYGQHADVDLLKEMREKQAARRRRNQHHNNGRFSLKGLRGRYDSEALHERAREYIKDQRVTEGRITKTVPSTRSHPTAQLRPVFSTK